MTRRTFLLSLLALPAATLPTPLPNPWRKGRWVKGPRGEMVRVIYIPPGTYHLLSAIEINRNMILRGHFPQ